MTRRSKWGLEGEVGGAWFDLYDSIVAVAGLGVRLAAPFHAKLRASLEGRKGGINRWRINSPDDRPSILIHVASRGEYESVCPLLDRLLLEGSCRVALSFSSPSVEKTILEREDLWACGYLPLDYYGEQLRFLTRLDPTVILISKHDIWPNMLRSAATLALPVILANANFHSRSRRRWPVLRSFNRHFLHSVAAVWTVSESDAARVKPLLSDHTELAVVGDTRYDQALHRAELGKQRFEALKKALGPGPVFVAGSCWPPEEAMIWPAFHAAIKKLSTAKLLLAPHELGDASFLRNKAEADSRGLGIKRLSEWAGEPISEPVIYLDSMGVLAEIYAVGWTAIVGGGFGKGVHSVLEPAAHGLPVAFGPHHHVSNEAGLLLEAGGGFMVEDAAGLEKLWLGWMDSSASYSAASKAALEVVLSRAGATDRVLERLQPFLVRR
jgi:3-deoxy-D-manno-octulosonic-acid transferase